MIVYCITNNTNGKKYVGRTKLTLEKRVKEHMRTKNSLIGKEMKSLGLENFSFDILEEVISLQEANTKEFHWVRELNTITPNGYNQCDGGGSTLNYRHTEDAKMRMSITKKNIGSMVGENNHFYGKKHTEKTREKMSDAWKSGKREMTEEHQKKLRESAPKRKVMNLDTGEIFNSLKEASEKYKVASTNISRSCRDEGRRAAKCKWKYM